MFKIVFEKNGQEKMFKLNTNKLATAKHYAMEMCQGQPNIKLYEDNVLVASRLYHEFCGLMSWTKVDLRRSRGVSSD